MSNPVFDREAIRRFRVRAASGSGNADFLMKAAAGDLADRLSPVKRRFDHTLAVHCLTGDAETAVLEAGKTGKVTRIEASQALPGAAEALVATDETLPPGAVGFDLAVSLYGLQDINDLPGMLVQVRHALLPDGLFVAAMAGAGTLAELRESLIAAESEICGGAHVRVHPFLDVRDAGALLQRAGFALPVADTETVTVRYGTMFALMTDLRAMGMQNALVQRSRKPAAQALFMRAAEIYAERFSDSDGRIRATFNTVWMSGWAPHETQQQPLARGSARMRLADALKNAEGE